MKSSKKEIEILLANTSPYSAWDEIAKIVDQLSEVALAPLLPLLLEGMESWPDEYRPAPDHWKKTILETQEVPLKWKLVRSLELDEPDKRVPKEMITGIRELTLNDGRGYYEFDLLSDAENLQKLDYYCSVYGSDEFSEVPQLKQLLVHFCGDLQEIDGLADLEQLQELYMDDLYRCEQIYGLICLPLKKLHFRSLPLVEDFSPISTLEELTALTINSPNIKSLSFLEGLNKLEELDIYGADLTKGAFPSLPLKKLSLRSCKLPEGLGFLSKFPSLTKLHLNEHTIKDLQFPEEIGGLTDLSLYDCKQLTSVKGIARQKDLKYVFLDDNNELEDIAEIAQLKKMKVLDLSRSKIGDIGFLNNLDLMNLYIKDCENVQNVDKIEGVSIYRKDNANPE